MENKILKLIPVNNQNLEIIETADGKLVPIRPICDVFGISYQSQIDKIKDDEILAPTLRLSISVASDGKDREMQCLPYKYIFGWLFTINPKNVSPESAELVKLYKAVCYDILYNNLADKSDFLEEKQKMLDEKLSELQIAQYNFNQYKDNLKTVKATLQKIQKLTFEEWQFEKNQLTIVYEPVNN